MESSSHEQSFAAWKDHKGFQRVDTDFVTLEILRKTHPNHHVTRTDPSKCDLIAFARAGHATANQQVEDGYDATRAYEAPATRLEAATGKPEDVVSFGRWCYQWESYEFVLYEILYCDTFSRPTRLFYILAHNAPELVHDGHHEQTDALLVASGEWTKELHEEIWVFDNSQWTKNKQLWKSVQDASWDDVILDPVMKSKLIRDVQGFFDSQEMYQNFRVPWKRGVILHGVPGNGKTISIKALINSLASRPHPVHSLYVKSLDACSGPKWSLQQIFRNARRMAPCLLIFEDLDSLVTDETRSYFLNEVDGLESNDDILMVGSTNHIDRLDPSVTKRPSRFDRKYHFQIPGEDERVAYSRYWRQKFEGSEMVDFPDATCPIIAKLTEGYSFAYLKELFVTSLLLLARGGSSEDADEAERSDMTSTSDAVMVGRDSAVNESTSYHSEKSQDESNSSLVSVKALPEVEIPKSLQGNELLGIIKSQAKLLLDEMEHAGSEAAKKPVNRAGRPGRAAFAPQVFISDSV
ncbi:putative AAA+ ATPase domain-containing protein [Seiridium cardinale]